MRALTPRQVEVLAALARLSARGYSATHRELCEAVGVTSTNAVADHLDALERKGAITRRAGIPRSVVITDDGWAALRPDPSYRSDDA